MSIKIALAGNPNSGKTTLFNSLTGSNQYVGNWPGVTVEKKEGKLRGNKDTIIMDLPGIYSLSPYTLEEVVARNYLINEKPDAIINIIDGTNLERNLYLTTQLMELGIPVIIAVNMMDLMGKNGVHIKLEKLSENLGCQVVQISALKGTGVDSLVDKAQELAKNKNKNFSIHRFDSELEMQIQGVEGKLETSIPKELKRFYAIKLIESDDKIAETLHVLPDITKEIETLEQTFDDDAESIIINQRYSYISSIIDQCVVRKK